MAVAGIHLSRDLFGWMCQRFSSPGIYLGDCGRDSVIQEFNYPGIWVDVAGIQFSRDLGGYGWIQFSGDLFG